MDSSKEINISQCKASLHNLPSSLFPLSNPILSPSRFFFLPFFLPPALPPVLQVFGAFVASDLLERHQSQFFGTGETFLFRLLPETCCYCWSGKTDLILRGTEQELLIGSGGG